MKETIQDEARTVKDLTTLLASFKDPPNSANVSRSRSLGASAFDGKENQDDDPQVWPAPPDPPQGKIPYDQGVFGDEPVSISSEHVLAAQAPQ